MNAVSHIITECPGCKSSFKVSEEHLGKKAKCSSCGKGFVVSLREEKETLAEPAKRSLNVLCRLCGTRLYGAAGDVGRLLGCPDCGTKTRLPPPERRKGPNIPAALEGEQYALWEEDEQPWGADLAAEQEKQLPVHCSSCETLMYAKPEQLGEEIECPDCGHTTTVHARATDDEGPRPVADGMEYQVDEGMLSMSLLPPSPAPIYSRLQDIENLQAAEEREKQIQRAATDLSARPQLPRWPLVTGWFGFVRASGVMVRWISLSIVLAITLALGAVSVSTMMGAGIGLSAYSAVAGLCFLCIAGVFGVLGYGASAAFAMVIVTETSEGNDQIQPWPPNNPIEWLGEALHLFIVLSASAIPGWAIAKLAGGDSVDMAFGLVLSVWLFLPLVLLSTLEAASPWALIASGVLGGVRRLPGTWVTFYVLSGAGIAAVAFSIFMLGQFLGAAGLLLAVPMVVGGLGLYFRLVGRLAWKIREED